MLGSCTYLDPCKNTTLNSSSGAPTLTSQCLAESVEEFLASLGDDGLTAVQVQTQPEDCTYAYLCCCWYPRFGRKEEL